MENKSPTPVADAVLVASIVFGFCGLWLWGIVEICRLVWWAIKILWGA
jgi:hypothetical protein